MQALWTPMRSVLFGPWSWIMSEFALSRVQKLQCSLVFVSRYRGTLARIVVFVVFVASICCLEPFFWFSVHVTILFICFYFRVLTPILSTMCWFTVMETTLLFWRITMAIWYTDFILSSTAFFTFCCEFYFMFVHVHVIVCYMFFPAQFE